MSYHLWAYAPEDVARAFALALVLHERLRTASVLDGSRARELLGFEPSRDRRQMPAGSAAIAKA